MSQRTLLDDGPDIEELRDETAWLDARRNGIGASEAPMILGLSPFKSRLHLFAEKLELVEPDDTEREILYWGKTLEAPIAERYATVTGRKVQREAPYTLRRSRQHAFMVATLDALTWPEPQQIAPLEIKNVGAYRADDWHEEPPLHIQVQVQHQLAVTGYQRASIAALVGGNRLIWMDVTRNDRFIAALIEKETEFWQRLLAHDPPPVDGSESARDILRKLYPRETPGLVVNLPGEAVDWDTELQQVKKAGKDYEDKKLELENKIKAAIGEAEAGILPNGTSYTWKASERKGYVVEATVTRTLRRKEAT